MNDLSAEQSELKQKITRNAAIWGGVAGLVVFLLVLWLAGGLGELLRWALALALGGAAGWSTYRGLFGSAAAQAKCASCGTAFSRREVSRSEAVLGREPKRKVERIEAVGADPAREKTTTWTEEAIEVTAVDACGKCGGRSERTWKTTREADREETERVLPSGGAGPVRASAETPVAPVMGQPGPGPKPGPGPASSAGPKTGPGPGGRV